jgi:hypothetical protein
MAQDIAYRAGYALVEIDGASWLKSECEQNLVCQPDDPQRLWYQTWLALDERYPALSRLWAGVGRVFNRHLRHDAGVRSDPSR